MRGCRRGDAAQPGAVELRPGGQWLDGQSGAPCDGAAPAGLCEQLRLQQEASQRLKRLPPGTRRAHAGRRGKRAHCGGQPGAAVRDFAGEFGARHHRKLHDRGQRGHGPVSARTQFALPAAGGADAQTLGPHPGKSPRNWAPSCRRSRTRRRWAHSWSKGGRPTRFIFPNCRWPC